MGWTKTDYVFALLFFYGFIFTMIGFYGATIDQDLGVSSQEQASFIAKFDIIAGISTIPTWINVLIFGSLTSFVLWIVASSFLPSGS